MFVLGELAWRLAEEGIIYSVLATITAIVVMKISGKSAHTKCSDLLLFYFAGKSVSNFKNHEVNFKPRSGCKILKENALRFTKEYLFLTFICLFFLGVFWGYVCQLELTGTLEATCDSGQKVEMTAYISKIEEREKGTRVTLKTSEGGVTMYVKEGDASLKTEEKQGKWSKERESKENKKYQGQDGDIRKGKESEVQKEQAENQILEPGHYIKVSGYVEKIQGLTNPGGMDMEEYYAGKGIRYQLTSPDYSLIPGKKNLLVNQLYHIRKKMASRLEEAFDEENAGIMKTMLLGDRSSLSTEVKVLYQRSGIAHVLAISGLHIMLLAGVLEWLLMVLGIRKNISVCITIVLSVVYGVLTGMSEATLRAVIMLIILRVAFLFGRTSDMPTSMMEALLIMIIINPDCILSTGLLMSFLAVIGVMTGDVITDHLLDRRSFEGLPPLWKKRLKTFSKGIMISASINLWMCPLMMRSYYEVPIVSMLLNIIVVPLLTVVVASGFIVMILERWAGPAVWICEKLLWFYKKLCILVLKLPCSVFSTGHIEVWQLILAYLVLIAILLGIVYVLEDHLNVLVEKLGKRWRLWSLLLVLAVYAVFSFGTMGLVKLGNELDTHLAFLDVGQGDGAIVHKGYRLVRHQGDQKIYQGSQEIYRRGRNYIVDCGSTSTDSVGQYTLIPALKYYGMTHIRCIFISHMDKDHMNGIVYLLRYRELYGFDIDYVAVAEATEVDENYEELLSVLGDTELIELGAGDVVDECFQVCYPFKGCAPGSGNDHSLVLDMRYGDVEVLYTGDISGEVEKQIVDSWEEGLFEEDASGEKTSGEKVKEGEKTRILKCPHHGSRYSCSHELLEWFDPDVTVISCGKNNTYGHPHREALERLENQGTKIYRTDEGGAVLVE